MVRWRKRLFQCAKLGCILALCSMELTHPWSARGLNPDVQITQYAHDGVGKEDGAYLWFYVQPAFYQRIWFKILLGVLGLVALWLFYLYRLHKATESVRLHLMERLAERERIARDLHDTFFQGIQGLLLRFNTGTNQLPPDATARPIFVTALEQSDQVMLEGRKLVFHLRETNESAFLEDALAQAGEELRAQHAVPFKLTALGTQHNLQPEASRELYSLGREALYNAFRHASATLIELELHYSVEGVVLKVRDDGHGISKDVLRDKKRDGHWGLPGMHERAEKLGGRLTLWSGAGSGTEIEVSVPADTVYREEPKSLLPRWVSRWLRPWTSMPK
jgi:signal transduction histidine kinase